MKQFPSLQRAAALENKIPTSSKFDLKIYYAEQLRNNFSNFLKENENLKITEAILKDKQDQFFQVLLKKIEVLTQENLKLRQKIEQLEKHLEENKKTLSPYIPPNNQNINIASQSKLKKRKIFKCQSIKQFNIEIKPKLENSEVIAIKQINQKLINKINNTHSDTHLTTTIQIPDQYLLKCCESNSGYCQQLFTTENRLKKKDSQYIEEENLLESISFRNKSRSQRSPSNSLFRSQCLHNVPKIESVHEASNQNLSQNNDLSSFFAQSYKTIIQENIKEKKGSTSLKQQLIKFSKSIPDTPYRAFYCLIFVLQKPIRNLMEIMSIIKKDKKSFLLPYELKDNQVWIKTVEKFISQFRLILATNETEKPDIHIFSQLINQNPLIDKLLIQILKYSIKDKISSLVSTQQIIKALSQEFALTVYCNENTYQFCKYIPNCPLNNSLTYSQSSSACNFPKLYQQIILKLTQLSDKFTLCAYEDVRTLTNFSPLVDQDQYFSNLEMNQKWKNVSRDQNVIRTKEWQNMNE